MTRRRRPTLIYSQRMNLETNLTDIVPPVPDENGRRSDTERLRELAELPRDIERSDAGPWQVVSGEGVLFSAPHAAQHVRDGREKSAERGTAGLAFGLARHVGGSGIATVDTQLGDPSWDIDHPYVGRARRLVRDSTAVDIHIMRPRGVDLCVGLGPVPAMSDGVWQPVIDEAVNAGLRVSINWPYGANPRTVTAQLQRLGVRSVQLELSWDCFDPAHPAMTRAWSALSRAAERLSRG